MGGRRRCDAGGAGRPRRGVARRDRGARRLFVQATPVTVCAPRSPRRGPRSMLRWPRSGRWSCRCGWALATGEAELRGRGLLRHGAQPCGAGDGRRARRSDPGGRLDGGVCSAELIFSIWGRDGCVMCRAPVGVFQVRAPGLRTEFPSLRALDTSPGNLRPAATQLHRT